MWFTNNGVGRKTFALATGHPPLALAGVAGFGLAIDEPFLVVWAKWGPAPVVGKHAAACTVTCVTLNLTGSIQGDSNCQMS